MIKIVLLDLLDRDFYFCKQRGGNRGEEGEARVERKNMKVPFLFIVGRVRLGCFYIYSGASSLYLYIEMVRFQSVYSVCFLQNQNRTEPDIC